MGRPFRYLTALVVAAAALGTTSASGVLSHPASAATPALSVTATWIYPGYLALTVDGTPTAPTTNDESAPSQHRADWSVVALPPSTACPTTVTGQSSYDDSDGPESAGATVAEGEIDNSTLAYSHHVVPDDSNFPDMYTAFHLCGMLWEEQWTQDASGFDQTDYSETITATTDTALPARVPTLGVQVVSAYTAPKIRANDDCVDRWTAKQRTVLYCDLHGEMRLSVTKAVAHKLKLPSTVIGVAALHPASASTGGEYFSYFTISKAMSSALQRGARRYGHGFDTTLTASVTSPVTTTMTKTYRYGSNVVLCSWSKTCS